MDIGEKIKQYRNRKEMSLYRLSQLTGIAQNNLQKIEDSISIPTIETLEKVIPVLGLTLPELFSESEECCYVTPYENELLQELRALDKTQQAHILQTIKYMKKL